MLAVFNEAQLGPCVDDTFNLRFFKPLYLQYFLIVLETLLEPKLDFLDDLCDLDLEKGLCFELLLDLAADLLMILGIFMVLALKLVETEFMSEVMSEALLSKM